MPSEQFEGFGFDLEFLTEAALVVDLDGQIHSRNSAARTLFGGASETPTLGEAVVESRDDVKAYLLRASGSTSPHIGRMTVRKGGATAKFRALGARLKSERSTTLCVILRLVPIEDNRFSILNRRLQEMDNILHRRLKENALLKEALNENRVLLRELQHRVKNNIQQMMSLIRMSAANLRSSREVADIVNTATYRLRAMAVAQEALYQNAGSGSISVPSFLEDVVKGATLGHGAGVEVTITLQEGHVTMEEAHCLSLICNELLTNACKYGIVEGRGRIDVSFLNAPDGYTLIVRDDGPGFDRGSVARSSGLTLVQGLCRQIGGKFEVSNDQGSICLVSFRSEST